MLSFRGNIMLHNQPAEALPFAADSFDAVTSYAFRHHVEDYFKVVREVHRVLSSTDRSVTP